MLKWDAAFVVHIRFVKYVVLLAGIATYITAAIKVSKAMGSHGGRNSWTVLLLFSERIDG
jgi:hypothetical protein